MLVGSITGFNWSKFSDIDLHIILDFDKLSEKHGSKEALKLLFNHERFNFNRKHKDLYIYGYPVELYVQDISEENISAGVYSVLHGRWIKIPVSSSVTLDRELIKVKSSQFINIIDKYEEISKRNLKKEQYILLKYRLDTLFDEIVQGRKTSLAKDGEYAADNIVFKVLRRSGHLGKLNDLRTYVFDRIHSVKTRLNESFIGELSSLNTDNFYKTDRKSGEVFKTIDQFKFNTDYRETPDMIIIGEYLPLGMNMLLYIRNEQELFIARVTKTSLINIKDENIIKDMVQETGVLSGQGRASEEIKKIFQEKKPARDFAGIVNKRFNSKLQYTVFCASGLNESLLYENTGSSIFGLSAVDVEKDSPVNNLKYAGIIRNRDEAKRKAVEWAAELHGLNNKVICVSVMCG